MGGVLDADEMKVPLIPESGESLGGLVPKRMGSLPLRTVALNLVHKASDDSQFILSLWDITFPP